MRIVKIKEERIKEMKRGSNEWYQLVDSFEDIIKKEYGYPLEKDMVDNLGNWLPKTKGYWYANEKTNCMFRGFLHGIAYMELQGKY